MTDLDKLIEAVELAALPEPIFHGSSSIRGHWAYTTGLDACERRSVFMAYNGSLDAAKTLHEAVLHNHVISSLDWKWGGLVEAHIFEVSQEQWHEPGMAKFIGRSSTPARAWLIAILKAYRSKVQE